MHIKHKRISKLNQNFLKLILTLGVSYHLRNTTYMYTLKIYYIIINH